MRFCDRAAAEPLELKRAIEKKTVKNKAGSGVRFKSGLG
jgi:hypothetical protein